MDYEQKWPFSLLLCDLQHLPVGFFLHPERSALANGIWAEEIKHTTFKQEAFVLSSLPIRGCFFILDSRMKETPESRATIYSPPVKSLAVLVRNKPLFLQDSEILGHHRIAQQILTSTSPQWCRRALHSLMWLFPQEAPQPLSSTQASKVTNAWYVSSLLRKSQMGILPPYASWWWRNGERDPKS